MGFPGGSMVKNPPVHVGMRVPSLSGRCLEEGNVNVLQDSCLGNPMDREASWATVHGGRK